MTALQADKNILEKYDPRGFRHDFVGADSTQFFKGSLVGILAASGRLKKAAAADANLRVVGVCEDNVLTGASNTKRIGCRSGIFKFAQSGTTITAADVGAYAFVVDDQTVAKTNAGDDPVAGEIYDVDTDGGVWVAVNFPGGSNAKGTTAAAAGALSPFSGA